MQKELVSIIIPVYQAERYLERGIQSVLSQTYRPIEILLVDDGSTDGSAGICDGYAKKYREIAVYHREHKGVSAARNYGIEQAKGKYVQFADADDEMKPEMIEKLVYAIEKEDAYMSVCGYEIVNQTVCRQENFGAGNHQIKCYSMNDVYEIVMCDLLSVTWNKLYVRERICDLYCNSMLICEDSVFCTRYFLSNPKLAICPELLYRYYRSGNHMSEQRIFRYQDIKRYFYQNCILVGRISNVTKRKKARYHVAKVFFYGVYTYIFEVLPDAEISVHAKLAVIKEVICDKVYIHTIHKLRRLYLKENCYKAASVLKNEKIMYFLILCRKCLVSKGR